MWGSDVFCCMERCFCLNRRTRPLAGSCAIAEEDLRGLGPRLGSCAVTRAREGTAQCLSSECPAQAPPSGLCASRQDHAGGDAGEVAEEWRAGDAGGRSSVKKGELGMRPVRARRRFLELSSATPRPHFPLQPQCGGRFRPALLHSGSHQQSTSSSQVGASPAPTKSPAGPRHP